MNRITISFATYLFDPDRPRDSDLAWSLADGGLSATYERPARRHRI